MNNHEIEQKLKDNVKIVYQVINDLLYIPINAEKEDLEQIGKIALWKAMKSYEDDFDFSLSTHCYKTIYRDVLDYLRRLKSKKRKGNEVNLDDYQNIPANSFEDELNCNLLINEISKYVSDEETSIFVDRHLLGTTLDELAVKYGFSYKQIRSKLEKSKEILKKKINWKVEG